MRIFKVLLVATVLAVLCYVCIFRILKEKEDVFLGETLQVRETYRHIIENSNLRYEAPAGTGVGQLVHPVGPLDPADPVDPPDLADPVDLLLQEVVPTPVPGQPDILITGPPRSGTTIIGALVSYAKGTLQIYEPMSHDVKKEKCYIGKKPSVYKRLDINVDVDLEGWKDYYNRMFLICKNGTRGSKLRLILKDPIALKYAEWLTKRYGLLTVVKVRHPGALLASDCKRFSKWTSTNCSNEQIGKLLATRHYQMRLLVDLYKKSKDLPNWFFLPHESFCTSPILETKRLFNFLRLDYHSDVTQKISALTSKGNPKESRGYKKITLDAKQQIHHWKKWFTKEQKARLKRETKYYWKVFGYEDSSW